MPLKQCKGDIKGAQDLALRVTILPLNETPRWYVKFKYNLLSWPFQWFHLSSWPLHNSDSICPMPCKPEAVSCELKQNPVCYVAMCSYSLQENETVEWCSWKASSQPGKKHCKKQQAVVLRSHMQPWKKKSSYFPVWISSKIKNHLVEQWNWKVWHSLIRGNINLVQWASTRSVIYALSGN